MNRDGAKSDSAFISVSMKAAEVRGERVLGGALLVTEAAVHQLQLAVLRLPVSPALKRLVC